MIRPQKAPVRPRVYVSDSPETMLLEDVVPLLRERSLGMVAIVGPWGAGKTTALAHLADCFSDDACIIPAADAAQAAQAASSGRLVVFTSPAATPAGADECLRLAPWGQDELIEYLLSAHPQQCGSVMPRLARADDRQSIPGLPELWRIVLDRMAEDESLTTIRDALVRELDSCLPSPRIREMAEDFARDSLCGDERARKFAFRKLSLEGDRVRRLMRLLGHRIIRAWLAADNLAGQLKADAPCVFLTWRLPLDLIDALSDRVSGDDGILDRLRGFAEGTKPRYHSTTATILHTTGCGWVPKRKPTQPQPEADTGYGWQKSMRRRKPKVQPKRIWLDLAGASLPAATWPGIDLIWAGLTNVDFTAADLIGATLAYSDAQGACFRCAVLVEADLSELAASGADFTSADLYRSRARHARFDAANLTEANLSQAVLGERLRRRRSHRRPPRRGTPQASQLPQRTYQGSKFLRRQSRLGRSIGHDAS